MKQLHNATTKSILANDHEVICHGDFSPWNMVVKNQKIVGVIDFDEARPGSRVEDLAYMIWCFLDLGNEVSIEN